MNKFMRVVILPSAKECVNEITEGTVGVGTSSFVKLRSALPYACIDIVALTVPFKQSLQARECFRFVIASHATYHVKSLVFEIDYPWNFVLRDKQLRDT